VISVRKVALIGARGGSKRLPGKNIKNLCGIPLIAHTIEAAKKSGFKEIIVTTDCAEISDVAKKFGAQTPFIRPERFASDQSSDFDVINHFIENYAVDDEDYIFYLRPTTLPKPLKLFEQMDYLLRNNKYDLVRSVKKVNAKSHPYWTFSFNGKYLSEFVVGKTIDEFYQSQLLPDCFALDGVIDAYLVGHIRKNKKLLSDNFGGLMNENKSFDIDDLDDFLECETFFRNGKIIND